MAGSLPGGALNALGTALIPETMARLQMPALIDQAKREQQVGNIQAGRLLGGADAEIGTPQTKSYQVNGRTIGQDNPSTVKPLFSTAKKLALFSQVPEGARPLVASQAGLAQPNYVNVDNVGLVQTNAPGGPKKVIEVGQPQRTPNFVTLGNGRAAKSFDVSDPAQLATARQLAGTGWTEVKTPPASVNVNMPDAKGDVKYMEEMGKLMAEDFGKIQAGGATSQQSLQKFDRLGGLLEGINTGAFKGTTTQLKSIAKSAGVDLDSLGVRDDVAPAQAAKAIANEIALQLRNPSGGAGMPGAMSDSDREFLMQMVPGLETTPEGNKLLVDYWRRVNRRGIDVARMARDYVKKNDGKFDYGFYDVLNDYAEKNPLFAKEQASVATAATRPRATNPLTGEAVEWNGTEWEMVK